MAMLSTIKRPTNYPIFATTSLLVILAGCSPPNKLYYWGSYSSSLHNFRKAPNKKTTKAYQNSLADIIKTSEENHTRVPPGIFAEYGYSLAKEGKTKKAMALFDLEKKSYPESGVLTQRLKKMFKKDK